MVWIHGSVEATAAWEDYIPSAVSPVSQPAKRFILEEVTDTSEVTVRSEEHLNCPFILKQRKE